MDRQPRPGVPDLPAFDQAPWTRGAAPALIVPGPDGAAERVWTYDGLTATAAGLAESLRAAGLKPGQLVAVSARPGARLVLMQHALARAGAALLPVPAGEGAADLAALAGAEWTWGCGPRGAARLVPAALSAPAASRPVATGKQADWPSPLALVVATSGSSGVPRAVMLTASNLLSAAALSNRHLGLGARDCWLCCLPLRHIGGLSIVYRCALAGAAVLLHAGFEAARVAADLGRRCVTHLSLVPPMLARLLDLGARVPETLRVVLVGGQALTPALAARAIAAGWPLHVTYGMTETASQIATSERLRAAPEPGVVGRPLPGIAVDCPPAGRPPAPLRVRGPTVMAGYANPERRPGSGLAAGWFTTADLACRAPDGTLRVLGRADEMLVTGGVNVHPGWVESRLADAPGIGSVAVVGVPDPVWGARLVALYTGPAEPAALDRWCRERLPGPERPRDFRPRSELPVLPSGKLDRRALRDLAASGDERAGRPLGPGLRE